MNDDPFPMFYLGEIMTKFNVRDLEVIKNAKLSPAMLKRQLGMLIDSSGNYRAIVASFNRMTGEYRIVLQGTLDTKEAY